jgi:hypothetical protein
MLVGFGYFYHSFPTFSKLNYWPEFRGPPLLLIASVAAFKIVQIGPVIFPAGLVIFPFSYIFDDILNKDYYDYETNFNPFRLKVEN